MFSVVCLSDFLFGDFLLANQVCNVKHAESSMEPPASAGSEKTKPDRHRAAPLLLDLQTPGLNHGYAKTPFATPWEVRILPCIALLRDVGHVANDTCVPLGLTEGLQQHGNTAEKFIHTSRCVRISA